MLFSAGTFLYVATVHILPELLNQSSSHSHAPTTITLENPAPGNASQSGGGKLSRRELFYLVLGIFMPVVLGLYHKH